MGFYVHLSVIFACDQNDGVAALAGQHLEHLPQDAAIEARWFLEELSGRSGHNPGPKGGLSMWGIVGNHTDAANFVAALEQFWLDLFYVKDGPLSHEHILVFHEPEQSEQASAIEISLEEPDDPVDRADAKLVIKEHEDLPFAWMQF